MSQIKYLFIRKPIARPSSFPSSRLASSTVVLVENHIASPCIKQAKTTQVFIMESLEILPVLHHILFPTNTITSCYIIGLVPVIILIVI